MEEMSRGIEQFPFLKTHHLLIVTEHRVQAWSSNGIATIFTPGTGRLVAAKESHDGQNTLVVADDSEYVLWNTAKGPSKTQRITGAEDGTKLLYFAPATNKQAQDSIYYTSKSKNAVQRYSLKESRSFDCGPLHPSPITAFAVSYGSRLLLSISTGSSTIYLQNLEYASAKRAVTPRVSSSPAVCVDFHPKRQNIFLLGFQDGSLAIYDATKIIDTPNQSRRWASSSAEIKSFPKVRHVVSKSATAYNVPTTNNDQQTQTSSSVTVARFLGHTRSQIIAGTSDGKCSIADFEQGTVLKSWHAKAPITSISLMQLHHVPNPAGVGKLRRSNAALPGQQTIIAIGRLDGKVLLYNDLGVLLAEQVLDEAGGRVIDVEFVLGKEPDVIPHSTCIGVGCELSKHSKPMDDTISSPAGTIMQNKKSPLTLLPISTSPTQPMQSKFKEHLSRSHLEVGDAVGTVKHIEIEQSMKASVPFPASQGYMDLFSPIKKPMVALRASPPRSRPRITSKTYTECKQEIYKTPSNNEPVLYQHERGEQPSNMPRHRSRANSTPRSAHGHQAAINTVATESPRPISLPLKPVSSQMLQATSLPVTKMNRFGSVSNVSSGLLVPQKSIRPSPNSSRSSSNSKILAELQKLDRLDKRSGVRKTGGNLAIFAPDYQLKHHEGRMTQLQTSSSRLQQSSRRKSQAGGSIKRASIGRVKVQKPIKTRARPRVTAQTAEDIFVLQQPSISNVDGLKELDSGSLSTVPSYDPEQPVKSSFSTDSSLLEGSEASVSSRRLQEAHVTTSAPVLSRAALAGEDTSSSATPAAHSIPDVSTEESVEPALPPGFAESFNGPVEVAAYLPRRNSLKFSTPGRSPKKNREPMSEIKTTSPRLNGGGNTVGSPIPHYRHAKLDDDKRAGFTCSGCSELKSDLDKMKKRQAQLEEEVKALRRLAKGKMVTRS